MTRRTRAERLDTTHKLLVEAGRKFFGTVGYAATSMDELAASVSLTRGALYHHFGGKSGLFAAVVAAIDAEIDTRLDAVAATALDPLCALSDRCATYIELTQAPDVQQIVFHDAPAALPAAVETSTAACLASIARLIADAQAAGLVDTAASPTALAVLLNGAVVDASRWVAAAPESEKSDRAAAAIDGARRLTAGLGRQS